jgi:hypothetical protein
MERSKRIQEIDEMIANLKKEKQSLQFTDSVFGGPNYAELCTLAYPDSCSPTAISTELNAIMSKLVRRITGVSCLAHYRLDPDKGRELKQMVEDISKAIINSTYWEKYYHEPKRSVTKKPR